MSHCLYSLMPHWRLSFRCSSRALHVSELQRVRNNYSLHMRALGTASLSLSLFLSLSPSLSAPSPLLPPTLCAPLAVGLDACKASH